MTTIRQQLSEAIAALEVANQTIGELNTNNQRLSSSNALLETQVFEFTNREGELRRDLAGTQEALQSQRAEVTRLNHELADLAHDEAIRDEQRRVANQPRPRTVAEMLEAHYDDKTHVLVVGEFRAVVENAMSRGESIVILGKDGKPSISITGSKLPKTALDGLRSKLVIKKTEEPV